MLLSIQSDLKEHAAIQQNYKNITVLMTKKRFSKISLNSNFPKTREITNMMCDVYKIIIENCKKMCCRKQRFYLIK